MYNACVMEYTLIERTLTIRLPLRIDTSSISGIESEIEGIIDANAHDNLIFDATDLEYISSVGLRLVLKWKKNDDTLKIINATSDVYDIFEMTGFTQILEVQKKFREISIEGCPLIGQGAYGKVYRLSPDTIVKSYFRGNPLSEIERERNLAKLAFVLGIPTAISYDVVTIKEEKLGTVYELIAADSLLDALLKNPDRYDDYLAQYVKLLDQMHNTTVDSDSIPSFRVDLAARLKACKGLIDPELYCKTEAFLSTLSDEPRLLHGDCHFKNVFVTPDGLLLIDMDTLSKGDPIYELGCLYKTYVAFDVLDPGNCQRFFGVSGDFCKKLFNDLFDGLEKDNPKKEEVRARVDALGWFIFLGHCCFNPEKKGIYIKDAEKILAEKLASL